MTPKRVKVDEWGDRKAGSLVSSYYEAARSRFVVEWYIGGKPRRKTFPHAPGEKAKARRAAAVYGQEVAEVREERRVETAQVATTAELYVRYVLAMESAWRPATKRTNLTRWRLWEAFFKPPTSPELVSEDILDDLHAALRRNRTSPNQVRQVFALLRAVYRLGIRRGWVRCSVPLTYQVRLGKDEAAEDPEEYSPAEWHRILGELQSGDRAEWRVLVAVMLAGAQGQRINSIRHLTWADVDLEGGTITWAAAWMKQGRVFEQPLTPLARAALAIAAEWRATMGYGGSWVLPAPRWNRTPDPVSYQTLIGGLRRAERRAGIDPRHLRGFHGFRRMAAENVYEGTGGDMLAAAAWIGDRDPKQLKSYLKRRDERLAKAAEAATAASAAAVHHTHDHTREERFALEGASEAEPLVGIEPTTATLSPDSQLTEESLSQRVE